MMARTHFTGRLSLIAGVFLLSGCSQWSSRGPLPPCHGPDSGSFSQDRHAWFQEHPIWHFEGRVALSVNHQGGSAQLSWNEYRNSRQIDVYAPFSHQHWRLIASADGSVARLEGLKGGPRQGRNARQLLLDATGFWLPIEKIVDWVRGFEPVGQMATVQRDPLQPLNHIAYEDWDVDYLDWQCGHDHWPSLPHRLNAYNPHAQVRLVIDHWDFP